MTPSISCEREAGKKALPLATQDVIPGNDVIIKKRINSGVERKIFLLLLRKKRMENEEYEDLLGYCRAWKIENRDQFWQKWIGHPKEQVHLAIFGELASYQSRETYTLEQQVHWVVHMWRHIQQIEHQRAQPFSSLCKAVRYLEREKIIPLQDNI